MRYSYKRVPLHDFDLYCREANPTGSESPGLLNIDAILKDGYRLIRIDPQCDPFARATFEKAIHDPLPELVDVRLQEQDQGILQRYGVDLAYATKHKLYEVQPLNTEEELARRALGDTTIPPRAEPLPVPPGSVQVPKGGTKRDDIDLVVANAKQ